MFELASMSTHTLVNTEKLCRKIDKHIFMYTLKSLSTYKYSLICKYIAVWGVIVKRKDVFGSRSVLNGCFEIYK